MKSGTGLPSRPFPRQSGFTPGPDGLMLNDLILAAHVLAAIVWIGFGFYELWLGRFFLANWDNPLGAPLARFIQRSDLAALIATMVVFLTGLAMGVSHIDRLTHELWLMVKLGLMTAVLGVVSFAVQPSLDLGRQINALPAGPGPVTEEIHEAYRRIEPWNLVMRSLAVLAVVSSIFKMA